MKILRFLRPTRADVEFLVLLLATHGPIVRRVAK
jgi:hypothetical protein